jgi:hypothetical protein
MWRNLALGVGGIALAGCSSPPPFEAPADDVGRPTVAQVVDKIQCEIAEARYDPRNNNPRFNYFLNHTLGLATFDKWVANITLSLTVSDTEGISPTSGLTLTYLNPATSFAFSANPILYQQRSRIYTQTYTLELSKIPRWETCDGLRRWHNFNLEGDLGLKDQIYLGLHTFDSIDVGVYQTAGASPDTFGATVSFDVFKGVDNVGPNWMLAHFQGPAGGVGYLRDDLNKIAVTFAPVSYSPPGTKGGAKAGLASAALSNAADRARQANQQLLLNQSIQELGIQLNRR